MALDDIKGDDWEVRATVHRNLVVARTVTETVRRWGHLPAELIVCMEFLAGTIGEAAEILEEDMAFHSGIGLVGMAGGGS